MAEKEREREMGEKEWGPMRDWTCMEEDRLWMGVYVGERERDMKHIQPGLISFKN